VSQLRFIEGALACGLAPSSLVIVEWNLLPPATIGCR
jgi:hypothetical protein